MKTVTLFLVILVALQNTETAPVDTLGRPESNILTRDSRHKFAFSGYPNTNTAGSQPHVVADEHSQISIQSWSHYGYQTKQDSDKVAYLMVNLKHKYYVRAFAVSGYAGGSHKPTSDWYLEGSNDGTIWKMVGIGKVHQWLAPGTYPFRDSQIIKCTYPGKYRYYRVIARGWTNNLMLINNLGLFQ